MMLYPSWAMHHRTRIVGKLCCEIAIRPTGRPAIRPPTTIHGVRLPKRLRVISDSVPKITFASSATMEPTALMVPSMDSLVAGLIFCNTCGRITVLNATHGMAHTTAFSAKPTPSRTISLLDGRCPSALTIGSRISLNAEFGSSTAASTEFAIAATGVPLSAPMRVSCTPTDAAESSPFGCVGSGTARRLTAFFCSGVNALSKSGRSSMPGRTYPLPGLLPTAPPVSLSVMSNPLCYVLQCLRYAACYVTCYVTAATSPSGSAAAVNRFRRLSAERPAGRRFHARQPHPTSAVCTRKPGCQRPGRVSVRT